MWSGAPTFESSQDNHSASVFRVDAYRWAGVSDGGERSFFSLLKGALRTVTGRVAKVNKKAYLMSTVVATIGVRGTEYSMQLQDASLTGAVADGAERNRPVADRGPRRHRD